MREITPTRKTTPRTPATCCARCGIKLSNPGTVVLGIGEVGPECIKHVNAALTDLAAGPLALLVARGEVRLKLQLSADGLSWIPSHDALSQYIVWADRAGIKLQHRIEVSTRTYILTIKPRSLQGYSVKSVQA
ncbi:hypothetical protein [Deinococcus sp. QL22]|uniref:hypothetical protein n=1 Tax=Deinococcus sp. QL22 TaxID=2939437 RepID=UPI002017E18A|nr:hypothetical protein [Deinococcus sp. QL22]UQN10292.1 hypothetical protein M1R55_29515 [Deinococcus sp. QL22]UQN10426.1 hypothetical protein M1R55_28840 [Deinococcus sp. QL22]